MSTITRPRLSCGEHDKIVLVGGEHHKNPITTVSCFNPLDKTWTSLQNLPFRVSRTGVAVMGQRNIYVAGGITEEKNVNSFVCWYPLNTIPRGWSNQKEMMKSRYEFG
ncbi:kelch-like protein 29 [Uloborus diversus]|uniref:kelch-like protein 29 n=1 Tax=Uloborus diversus TaxID=327109 RepID=UPI00240A6A9F|nr:kelch-like protein 29 [Uloborus diversus]